MAEHMTGKVVALMVLVHPFMLNLTEPMIFMLCLYIALIYGLLYIWVTLSPAPSKKSSQILSNTQTRFEPFPIVFIEIYHFNLGELGLAFLGIPVRALLVVPPSSAGYADTKESSSTTRARSS
jgi:DHA1 family multidrug resistance protein-like MFS transporter